MNKGQQRRMSKKDGKLLHNIFFNKLSFRRCPELPCWYGCVCFFIILLSHGSHDSVDQWMACEAWTCWHPFGHLSTPTEEYCETNMAQSGSRPLLEVETHLCRLNQPAPSGGNAPEDSPRSSGKWSGWNVVGCIEILLSELCNGKWSSFI